MERADLPFSVFIVKLPLFCSSAARNLPSRPLLLLLPCAEGLSRKLREPPESKAGSCTGYVSPPVPHAALTLRQLAETRSRGCLDPAVGVCGSVRRSWCAAAFKGVSFLKWKHPARAQQGTRGIGRRGELGGWRYRYVARSHVSGN